ncbi:MAG: hypothetical protein WCS70_03805 [Verrucomicrobiota bacterium]
MDDETANVEGNLCWGPAGQAWFDNSHSKRGGPGNPVPPNSLD